MNITTKIEGNTATLHLVGWLDTEHTPVLSEAVAALPENIDRMFLNMDGMEYISSAGLRQIVSLYKALKGNLTLINVPKEVLNVIRMTGLEKRLVIEQ